MNHFVLPNFCNLNKRSDATYMRCYIKCTHHFSGIERIMPWLLLITGSYFELWNVVDNSSSGVVKYG